MVELFLILLLVIIAWLLFIIDIIAGISIIADILYFIFYNKRISKELILPSEIVILGIIPAIFLICYILDNSIKETLSTQLLLTVGYIFAVVSYFISTYVHRILSLYIEIALALFITGTCIVCIIFTNTQDLNFDILIACIPIFLLFTIALFQQYKRCKKAYLLQKTLI